LLAVPSPVNPSFDASLLVIPSIKGTPLLPLPDRTLYTGLLKKIIKITEKIKI
jgi:hypothetical protein